jgi:hypothetical protein
MKRIVNRVYEIAQRDINEATLQWLRSKDRPVPQYVGNAGNVKWIPQPNGMRIEWTEEDEID